MNTPPSNHPAPSIVAVVGNPNTGKTTLFNALTGLRHRVGNYPGVTVETKKGKTTCNSQSIELIDLPGAYSLTARSPDEMLAVDILLGRQSNENRPDLALVIVDASNLERNLFLTSQILELGLPVVVALNMMDVARSLGTEIDIGKLAERLGVPVVPIQANKRIGLEDLRRVISESSIAKPQAAEGVIFPEEFENETCRLHQIVGADFPPFLVRRLLLDVNGIAEQRMVPENNGNHREQLIAARARLADAGHPVPAVEARSRYAWIGGVCQDCVRRPEQRPVTWTDRLDRILIHRLWGSLIFLALMFIVFESIFVAAMPLMDFIDAGTNAVYEYLRNVLPPGPLTSLLLDGLLIGVGAVLIFLPQIMILFFFIAVLEDCGYMARAAFLMDKLMARCGLSGKSFIPMLSSIACAVPGIMAARVIENRRDRLATILVAPLMSCSARLPVYILLIGAFLTAGFPFWAPGLTMFAMYLLGLVLAPLVAWALKSTLLRGETPTFVMEMPTYKWPSLRLVVQRMCESGWVFVRRAGTIILASMIVVWALLYFPYTDSEGRIYETRIAAEKDVEKAKILEAEWKKQSLLGHLGRSLDPIARPLGWDWRISVATLASFPAREVIVGTLGILFQQGETDPGDITAAKDVAQTSLGRALQNAVWDDDPQRKIFTLPVVFSVLVFFALCCQCASTLAIIKRETGTWRWPIFTFIYMTVLAYCSAFVVYQVGTLLGF